MRCRQYDDFCGAGGGLYPHLQTGKHAPEAGNIPIHIKAVCKQLLPGGRRFVPGIPEPGRKDFAAKKNKIKLFPSSQHLRLTLWSAAWVHLETDVPTVFVKEKL